MGENSWCQLLLHDDDEIWVVFQETVDAVFKLELYFEAVLLGIIVTGIPPYFAMDNAENQKVIWIKICSFRSAKI